MVSENIVSESEESIRGHHLRSNEWIEYKVTIKVKDSGRQPVSIDLEFVGMQPLAFDMPAHHTIRAECISKAFTKVMRFLKIYGVEMK